MRFNATFAIAAIGAAMFTLPVQAAPITAAGGLRQAAGVDVQTVQGGTQYGPDYGYYGPRYGSQVPRSSNRGEGSNTYSQFGDDYNYYGPRSGSRSYRSRNLGEGSPTGTQYGSDYQYYGPRRWEWTR
jgi:hypothetical protein